MCHPLLLTGVDIHFELHPEVSEIEAIASVRTTGKTGIEMEALPCSLRGTVNNL